MKSTAALFAFIALVALVGWFGAQFEPGEWYAALAKPPLTPPNWLFGPVWSVLYLALAIAAWMVWREPVKRGVPLALWGVQLVFNGVWSLLFFGLQRPGLALAEIVLLLAVIGATTAAFWRLRRLAGALMTPYLAWVAFACYLNAAIWYLNR